MKVQIGLSKMKVRMFKNVVNMCYHILPIISKMLFNSLFSANKLRIPLVWDEFIGFEQNRRS
jgi:hypothetical protein